MNIIDKRMEKNASLYTILDYFILPSGDYIEFSCRILSNKPWYQILHDSGYNKSSYYDGDNLDRAIHLYSELLLAFKKTGGAEIARQIRQIVPLKIENLYKEKKENYYSDLYNNLKRDPLFLGINDF